MPIVNSVRARRQEFRLTQDDLAGMCKVSRQTIIALEKGTHEPTLRLALRITRALDATVEALFHEDPLAT